MNLFTRICSICIFSLSLQFICYWQKKKKIRKKKVLTFKKIEKPLSTHEKTNMYIVAPLCYWTKVLVQEAFKLSNIFKTNFLMI